MRKILLLVVMSVLLANTGKTQYVSLPDANFRDCLRSMYPGCFNTAGQLDTTCADILNEDSLTVCFTGINNNLSGLQYFKNLIYLDCKGNTGATFLPALPENLIYLNCNYNALTALPALPISLKVLYCWGNQLSSLPALPAGLTELGCFQNQLHSLPTLPQSLVKLECYNNQLSSLPSLPPNLAYLDCNFNQINSLPALPLNLTSLLCYSNPLGSLPTLPPSLWWLSCSDNQLSSLPDLPQGLASLDCRDNQLTSLPTLPSNLRQFDCGRNQIGSLPILPPYLTHFGCYSNQISTIPTLPSTLVQLQCPLNPITSLPILPQSLTYLDCSDCQLSLLPALPSTIETLRLYNNPGLHCLPLLPVNLSMLIIDDQIVCIPNRPPSLYTIKTYDAGNYFDYAVSVCNPLNNSNNCQFYPFMKGSAFYDNNNNGIKDTNEPLGRNIKLFLTNGRFTFTNNNGLYEIGADGLGTYTLAANPGSYFDIMPISVNYNFTSYDTLVTTDFALQANTTINKLSIHITPINWAARPGFSFPYLINYENTGTTALSSNIIFDYDQTKLSYNTSSQAGVVDNVDNLTYNTGALVPGQSGSFIGYFTLKTTVPLGDTLNAKAIISANTFTAYDSTQIIVRGAFDPNDKQATPQLSPSQVANGDYIDYTIRFQNTGTDTAFTVVISDTLSEDLQANTLQMIASSHNCKTTVKDNIVFFEFINILLPDSNVNEPKSHGFVSFRIKPQTTVAVNTIIPNKAAIYFDYNAPVITNIASTLIKEFIVVPLKLISFSAVPQNDNTTSLYWNTVNEINTKQFVIEKSNDGLRFYSLTNIVAKGKANNSYSTTVADANTGIVFYRLKMVDSDGSFVYSPIIKIDKRKNAAGFSVLSNPVKDFIIISTTDRSLSNTPANIINMLGAVVKTFIVKEGSQTIEVNDLPNGIYYLKTINGSSKILIQ
ncbi:MAG: T9SS type A sorting domain-containing protein [Bacteroidota bacterium]